MRSGAPGRACGYRDDRDGQQFACCHGPAPITAASPACGTLPYRNRGVEPRMLIRCGGGTQWRLRGSRVLFNDFDRCVRYAAAGVLTHAAGVSLTGARRLQAPDRAGPGRAGLATFAGARRLPVPSGQITASGRRSPREVHRMPLPAMGLPAGGLPLPLPKRVSTIDGFSRPRDSGQGKPVRHAYRSARKAPAPGLAGLAAANQQ